MFYVTFCLLLVSSLTFAEIEKEDSLIFANTIWRHGARSSIYSYPSDPHPSSVWPQGPGQLTQVGMAQQYALGSYLKNRYSHFLSSSYKRSEIYIRSTDVDRTLMSAQSNLAGMYPPEGRQKWNGSDTQWQPIPVHTVPKSEDTLLRFPPSGSPQYDEIMKLVWSLPQFKELELKNKAFLEEIANLTSFEGSLTIKNSYQIRDTLVCEKAQNLTLPDWVTPYRLQKLGVLSGIEMGALFGANTPYREKIAQLSAGALVEQIIKNMDSNIDQSSSYKMIAYSAHDTTIAGLLVALDAYDMKPPPFATSVIFELHKEPAKSGTVNYFVKTFYRTNATESPRQLKIFGCDLACPLQELKKRAASVYPQPSPNPTIDDNMFRIGQDKIVGLFYIAVSLLLITWFIAILVCIRRKRIRRTEKSLLYQPIIDEESDDNGFMS